MLQSKLSQIFVIIFFLISINKSFGQDIDSLTYSMTQDEKVTQKMGWFSPTELKIYVDSKGNKIKQGDTLFVGSPSSSGTYSVGGAISSNNVNSPAVLSRNAGIYMFVQTGEYLRNTGAGMLKSEVGSVLIISQIGAKHTRNSKNSPMDIFIIAKSVRAQKFLGNDRRIITNYEKALEVEEVYLKNRKMTKKEALTILKEKKELYDLGVLSKEEFDKIKETLSPILLGQ
jgi:hypothetical protein